MKTLNELNHPLEVHIKRNENRLKLIELDRRLKQLNRMKHKNRMERFGIWLQKVGIGMQIRGVILRMKNSKG